MKEFFNIYFIQPFKSGDFLDSVLGLLLWLTTILLVSLFIWLSLWLIDSSFLPIKQKEGVITKHYYVPSHETTTFIMIGKVLVPQTNYYKESFEIEVEIDGVSGEFSLNKSFWDKIKIGDKFCFEYTNGRIYRTLYIKSFCQDKYN